MIAKQPLYSKPAVELNPFSKSLSPIGNTDSPWAHSIVVGANIKGTALKTGAFSRLSSVDVQTRPGRLGNGGQDSQSL